MTIWDCTDYRGYLLDRLGGEGSRTGLRKKLAEALPVHTTFVSQVMKGRAEFSLEQGEAINAFLNHTDDEGEFFLLLLLKDRAGSGRLRDRFERKLAQIREARINIKQRVAPDGEISIRDRERFYSSYVYGAVHVLAAIPQFGTVEALAEALKFSRAQTQEIVEFMLRIGILTEANGRLGPGQAHVHLGNDSELVLKHHANWRLHTLNNLQTLRREDLHYSACVSLSEADVLKIKESVLQNLQDNVKIISASPEEVAYVLSFDFYKLTT